MNRIKTPMGVRLSRRRLITPSGCWEWQGKIDRDGYGVMGFFTGRREGKKTYKYRRVHRVSYEHYIRPIPDGLVVDHLCRNRRCFNPDHLEAVTWLENTVRGLASPTKTHCVNGHEFNEQNTYRRGPRRYCRACNKAAAARYAAKRSAAKP